MSDTFDHEGDAWASLDEDWSDDDGSYAGHYHRTYGAPAPRTCRRCGTGGLRWGTLHGHWRLYAGDELHVCPPTEFSTITPP